MPKRARRRIRSMVRDFSLALCLSSVVILAVSTSEAAAGFALCKIVGQAQVHAVPSGIARIARWADTGPAAPMPLYKHTNRDEALAILALVISALAAFNMWILRHLRRVYVSSRRATARWEFRRPDRARYDPFT